MRKRAATLISAGLFAFFHIIVVVFPVVASGGNGESQAGAVLIFDMPLVFVLDHVPVGGRILYNDVGAYVAFFSLVGTLMYAFGGALLGYIIDKVRTRAA